MSSFVSKFLRLKGFCDWRFYSILQGGRAVVFDDLEIPFEPIIEVVSSFKLIYKQSTMFEYTVGDGKLHVCTLNLEKNDPAAMYLLETIVSYTQSDDFKPSNNINIDSFKQILNTKYSPS